MRVRARPAPVTRAPSVRLEAGGAPLWTLTQPERLPWPQYKHQIHIRERCHVKITKVVWKIWHILHLHHVQYILSFRHNPRLLIYIVACGFNINIIYSFLCLQGKKVRWAREKMAAVGSAARRSAPGRTSECFLIIYPKYFNSVVGVTVLSLCLKVWKFQLNLKMHLCEPIVLGLAKIRLD